MRTEIAVPMTVQGIRDLAKRCGQLYVDGNEQVYVTLRTEDRDGNVHRRNSVVDGELTVLVP